MVPVSIRLPQSEIDEIDKAAVERGRMLGVAWSRTDEIRERMQLTFKGGPVTVVRDDDVLLELRAVRELLLRYLANAGGR